MQWCRDAKSPVEQIHHRLRITRPGKSIVRRDFVDPREISNGKIDIERTDIFLQIVAPFGAGDWDDVVALGQYPGKRKLRRRALFRAGNFANSLHEIEIALKIIALKSWRRAPEIVFLQILRLFDFAGQKSAAQRTVRHEADAKLPANTKHFLLGVARPE